MEGLVPDGKRVLVAIPCLNEASHIEGLLTLLLRDKVVANGYIVVVDGGSEDGTQAIVERLSVGHPQVKLLHNSKRLQSAGVNLAVEVFGQDVEYLIRVDAHAGYPENYVTALISAAQEHAAQSVVVPMSTVGSDCFQRAVAAAQNSVLGTGGSAHRRAGHSGWVDHGHHALFDISAFRFVGGYNESFSHNEDAELDVRLKNNGAKIWLNGQLPIEYYPRSEPKSLFYQYLNYGRGRARTVRLHKIRLKVRQLIPIAVAPICIMGALTPFWLGFALPVLSWLVICTVYGFVIALKKGDRCAALSGVAAILMHFGWSLGYWRHILRG